jgi:hypothetical protein
MKLDDHIDKALSDQPVWEPPAHFARRVAMAVPSERRPGRCALTAYSRHLLRETS